MPKKYSALETILAVTYSVSRFDASVYALQTHLNYHIVEAGTVPKRLAQHWGAGGVSGARYCLLRPASNADFYLRFIESPPAPDYQPLKTYGWNATEFLVKDVHALAQELQNSAYTIIGGPRDLLEDGTAIALQVRGPSGEIFYLTELNGAEFQNTYGRADCKVDRAFIVVLGVAKHAEALKQYQSLAAATSEPRQLGIRVLANAHGLDPMNTKFTIASAILGGQYRIEIDGYPESAHLRTRQPNMLPPGLCMVSMTTSAISGLPLKQTSPKMPLSGHIDAEPSAPYFGSKLAMTRGGAEEWIELVES